MVTKYNLLAQLYGKSPLYLADIAPEDLKDSKALLNHLAAEGYVRSYNSPTGPFYLTDKGRGLYLELSEEQAKNKRDCVPNAKSEDDRPPKPPESKLVKALGIIATVVGAVSALFAIIDFLSKIL